MRAIPMTPFRLMTLPLTAALLLTIAACSKSSDTESAQAPNAEKTTEADHAESGEADHAEGAEAHVEAGEEGEAAEPVKMDEAALEAAGIKLQTLQPSLLSEELRAPGEVVDSAYGTTLITPRVEALVVRRHAKLGDEVRTGAPLVTPRLHSPCVMLNLLGDLWPRGGEPDWAPVLALPGVHLHLYGKAEPRPGRKMGHLTVTAASADRAAAIAREAAALLGLPTW